MSRHLTSQSELQVRSLDWSGIMYTTLPSNTSGRLHFYSCNIGVSWWWILQSLSSVLRWSPEGSHHMEVSDDLLEVGCDFVVLHLLRLQTVARTLYPHLGPLHLKQVHPAQVPQAPEQHLDTHARSQTHTRLNAHTCMNIHIFTHAHTCMNIVTHTLCNHAIRHTHNTPSQSQSHLVTLTSILKVLRTGRTPSGMT